MDKFEAYREQIDSYVQGRMDEDQRVRFEQILVDQPELKDEVDLLASYHDSFQRKDLIDFKSKLEKVAAANTPSNIEDKTAEVKKFRFPYLLVAAVIAILIVSVIVLNQKPKQTYLQYAQVEVRYNSNTRDKMSSVDSIYFDLESRLNDDFTDRSKLKSLIGFIEKAGNIEDYKNKYQKANDLLLSRAYLLYGNPKKTLKILDHNWQSDKTTCSVNYYRAVALLELERKKEAESVLEKLNCPVIKGKIEALLKIAKN